MSSPSTSPPGFPMPWWIVISSVMRLIISYRWSSRKRLFDDFHVIRFISSRHSWYDWQKSSPRTPKSSSKASESPSSTLTSSKSKKQCAEVKRSFFRTAVAEQMMESSDTIPITSGNCWGSASFPFIIVDELNETSFLA